MTTLHQQSGLLGILASIVIGIASWYGPELEGRPTANGEPFDPQAMTAASWHHPFGTMLVVTNPANGKAVIVRVNDRGPNKRLGRLIDLSLAAFSEIADPDLGLVRVEVQPIEKE
jgi:rare lipoprotein A